MSIAERVAAEIRPMASGFGDMQSLLKQAQDMQRRMQDTTRALSERTLEGSSGGGVVKAYVNGNQELQSVKIDKQAVERALPALAVQRW